MNGCAADGIALVDKPFIIVFAGEGYFVFFVVEDDDLVDGGGVFESEFGDFLWLGRCIVGGVGGCVLGRGSIAKVWVR